MAESQYEETYIDNDMEGRGVERQHENVQAYESLDAYEPVGAEQPTALPPPRPTNPSQQVQSKQDEKTTNGLKYLTIAFVVTTVIFAGMFVAIFVIAEDSVEKLSSLLKAYPGRENLCAMGIKKHNIPDSAMTASSVADSNHGARFGRLDTVQSGSFQGGWSTGSNRVDEWIQVDLGAPKLIAGIIIQGRSSSDYNQWVTSYKVSCGTSVGNLATILESGRDKIFQGNTDQNTKVNSKFPEPTTCRHVRVYPQT